MTGQTRITVTGEFSITTAGRFRSKTTVISCPTCRARAGLAVCGTDNGRVWLECLSGHEFAVPPPHSPIDMFRDIEDYVTRETAAGRPVTAIAINRT